MMDLKDTAKHLREILLLLLEGGFAMPIILTSIDRYGSLMVAEYTPRPGENDHWDCEMLAECMKSELFEPPINMLFVERPSRHSASLFRPSLAARADRFIE